MTPRVLDPVDPMVEGTLSWSLLAPDDLAGLAELREAIEYFDDPVEPDGDAEGDADADPQRNAVVGRDLAGTIVAYAWNHPRLDADLTPRVWLEGGVHPAWRHQSIGFQLMMWQINRALVWDVEHRSDGWGDLWIGRHVDTKNAAQAELLSRCDLTPERWFFDMAAPLAGVVIPELSVPKGIRLVRYCAEIADRVRQAHNEAFAGEPGARLVDPAAWAASMDRDAARPEWSWVAMHDDEVVGYAMNSLADTDDDSPQGWTDRLGVHPAWRGRGLAKALLAASMRSMDDAGCSMAWLGVDTSVPDAARSLYGTLGYRTQDIVARFGRIFGAAERSHHPVYA